MAALRQQNNQKNSRIAERKGDSFMNTNYFRITGYHPAEDISAVFDSNGRYGDIGQFSADLVSKGFEIIEASDGGKFLDGDIGKAEPEPGKIILRAQMTGEPERTTHEADGIAYRAVKVGGKAYVPDREKTATESAARSDDITGGGNRSTGNFLKKYFQIKAANPSAIVFYRIGDFYEIFSPDAETASVLLGLTLTARDCGVDRVPMCGVPRHCADQYVKKLTDCGFKVITAEPSAE
jgi:hypothetical protein